MRRKLCRVGHARRRVGLHLEVDNTARPVWYGEGDDMVFADGELWPPSIHGTGTEEIFGGERHRGIRMPDRTPASMRSSRLATTGGSGCIGGTCMIRSTSRPHRGGPSGTGKPTTSRSLRVGHVLVPGATRVARAVAIGGGDVAEAGRLWRRGTLRAAPAETVRTKRRSAVFRWAGAARIAVPGPACSPDSGRWSDSGH